MPRPVRRKNQRHPLKLLRAILSENPAEPISQVKLGEYIATPATSIKLLEAGHGGMGKVLAERIKLRLGARWVEWLKRWEFAFDPPGVEPGNGIPYTHELSLQYRAFIESAPPEQRRRYLTKEVGRAIELLLELASESQFNLLRFRIWRDIFEWQSQFQISGKVPSGGSLEQEGVELKEDGEEVRELLQHRRPAFEIEFDKQTGNLKSFAERLVGWLPEDYPKPDTAIFDPLKTPPTKRAKSPKRRAS
jgi:hypothetical protein